MTASNSAQEKTNIKPWYKHPWVWFIISLPLTAVVAGSITVMIANKHAPKIMNEQGAVKVIERLDEKVDSPLGNASKLGK